MRFYALRAPNPFNGSSLARVSSTEVAPPTPIRTANALYAILVPARGCVRRAQPTRPSLASPLALPREHCPLAGRQPDALYLAYFGPPPPPPPLRVRMPCSPCKPDRGREAPFVLPIRSTGGIDGRVDSTMSTEEEVERRHVSWSWYLVEAYLATRHSPSRFPVLHRPTQSRAVTDTVAYTKPVV
jgi:hypothetical protein